MPETIGSFLEQLQALKTKDEAKAFMVRLLEIGNPNTWSNIKYVTGYLNDEERSRILNLFR